MINLLEIKIKKIQIKRNELRKIRSAEKEKIKILKRKKKHIFKEYVKKIRSKIK